MLARRLSLMLSILAFALMALACSLGYRGELEQHALAVTTTEGRPLAQPIQTDPCQRLDEQLATCEGALTRVWQPRLPAHYPKKLRHLMAVKKRYALEDDALRACRASHSAPVAGDALEACLERPTCDEFATCVADSIDPF